MLKNDKRYIKSKKETQTRSRTDLTVMSFVRKGEQNHIDSNFATAITIDLPGPLF